MPAFRKNTTEGPGTLPVNEKQDSKFLSMGKYFLFGVLILGQVIGAYVVVDEHYKDIYTYIFGGLPDFSTTYKLEEIIANPAGSNAQRFLVVEIGMDLKHIDHIELLDKNLMKIRDRLNVALSSRTVNELIKYEEREKLRKELANEVNMIIGTRSVRNLYFIKYIMQ